MDAEALTYAFEAQSELIDTLIGIVRRHEDELQALRAQLEAKGAQRAAEE